jgi:group I intron endonuclease
MTGFIYLILNSINGKAYIGQTEKTIETRWIQHKCHAKTGVDYPLYRAIRKHGVENFSIIQLVSCDALFLNDLEKFFIKCFNTLTVNGCGYNLSEGGKGPSGQRSIETRHKVSQSLLGNKRSFGRIHSFETIAKMSAAHKRNPVAHWTGKKLSLATRMKMSQSRMGNRNRAKVKGEIS